MAGWRVGDGQLGMGGWGVAGWARARPQNGGRPRLHGVQRRDYRAVLAP